MVEKKIISFSVDPYCTLLFSREKNIKVVAWRSRPWNTTNTTVDIYMLVENGNQNTETKCKVAQTYYQVY